MNLEFLLIKRKLYISFFLLFYTLVSAASDIKIISSSESNLTFEFTPSYEPIDTLNIKGEEFISVSFLNGLSNSFSEYGMPLIKFRGVDVGVPSENGNAIQVINADYKIIKGKLVPVPFVKQTEFSYSYEYNIGENYFSQKESELASFGVSGMIRELPVQKINIYPVQFDAANDQIKIYSRIRVRVNFPTPKFESRLITDSRMKDAVINYGTAQKWGKRSAESSQGFNKIADNSLLSTGTWYKFTAPTEGIYKIDYNSLSFLWYRSKQC
jgi:hypothetical protein